MEWALIETKLVEAVAEITGITPKWSESVEVSTWRGSIGNCYLSLNSLQSVGTAEHRHETNGTTVDIYESMNYQFRVDVKFITQQKAFDVSAIQAAEKLVTKISCTEKICEAGLSVQDTSAIVRAPFCCKGVTYSATMLTITFNARSERLCESPDSIGTAEIGYDIDGRTGTISC